MTFEVEMPDGTVIYDVPDGTTKAQLQAKYARHTEDPSTGPLPPQLNLIDVAKGAKGAFDRTALGVKGLLPQPVQDAGDWIDRALGSGGLTNETAVPVPKNFSGTVGSIGTDIGLSLAPVATGASVIANALRAAKIAKISRAAPAVADVAANTLYAAGTAPEDRLEAALWGGGGAGVARTLPSVVGLLRGAKAGPQAQKLIDAGIQPSFGQVLDEGGNVVSKAFAGVERGARSLPFAGGMLRKNQETARTAFQQASRDAALPAKLRSEFDLKSGPLESIDEIGSEYSKAYEKTLGDIQGTVKLHAPDDILANVGDELSTVGIYDKASKFLEGIIPPHPITPLQAQKLESNLKQMASNFKGSLDPVQKEWGRFVHDIANQVGGSWRDQIPAAAMEKIAKLDFAYRKFIPIRRAAGKNPDLADPDKYTPKVLLNAIRAGDKAKDKSGFVRGQLAQQPLARAADDVLGSKSLEPGLGGTLTTGGTIAGAIMAPIHTTAAIVLTSLYALPGVQRYLIGQGVPQKAFEEWFSKLPDAAKKQTLAYIANAGRAMATSDRK